MCTKSFVLLRTFEVRIRTTDACAYVRRMVRTNDAYRTPNVAAYVQRTHRTIEVRTRTTDACAYVRRMVRTHDAYRTPNVVAYVKRTHRTIALLCMRHPPLGRLTF